MTHPSHKFSLRVCHWAYCRRCGLVALNNTATRKAMKQRCPGFEDET